MPLLLVRNGTIYSGSWCTISISLYFCTLLIEDLKLDFGNMLTRSRYWRQSWTNFVIDGRILFGVKIFNLNKEFEFEMPWQHHNLCNWSLACSTLLKPMDNIGVMARWLSRKLVKSFEHHTSLLPTRLPCFLVHWSGRGYFDSLISTWTNSHFSALVPKLD